MTEKQIFPGPSEGPVFLDAPGVTVLHESQLPDELKGSGNLLAPDSVGPLEFKMPHNFKQVNIIATQRVGDGSTIAVLPDRLDVREHEKISSYGEMMKDPVAYEARRKLAKIDLNEATSPIYEPEDIARTVRGFHSVDIWAATYVAGKRLKEDLERETTDYNNLGSPRREIELTARLVAPDKQKEILALVKEGKYRDMSYMATGSYEHRYRMAAREQQIRGELPDLGPTEDTPRDAEGQEVRGYALVETKNALRGTKGVYNTSRLVVYTAPAESTS